LGDRQTDAGGASGDERPASGDTEIHSGKACLRADEYLRS
jgi:hypothetical protein